MTLPTLDPSAAADLRAALAGARTVFFKSLPQVPSACPNCSGVGYHWFQFAKSGPYQSPPPKDILTCNANGWYVVESRFYPCPVCSDRKRMIDYLWDRSGLEICEREWRLDYIEGMPGKETALQSARDLLTLIPRPVGWHTYYGDYGVGKSGLLKSLVAACVRTNLSAHYTRAEDILAKIRSSFDDNSTSESAILAAYRDFPLLAIDEIDRTSTTGWARSTLLTLLDARYNRRALQATLLASNTSPQNLHPSLAYLSSRMKDGSRILIAGEDLRGYR